jgi:hypothetical protein
VNVRLGSCVGHTDEHLAPRGDKPATRRRALLDSGSFLRTECAGARPSSPEAGCLHPLSLAGSAAAEGAPSGQRSRQAASPSGRRSPSRAPAGPALPPRTTSSNRFALPSTSTVNRSSSWIRAHIGVVVLLLPICNLFW